MPRGRPKKSAEPVAKKTRGRPKKTAEQTASKPKRKLNADELYFALDIGTRTVVGVVGEKREDDFYVLECVSVPHTKRAMVDGQIEDIEEVAKVAKKVKDTLEKKLGITLSKVAIAAAGRALKTKRVRVDTDIDGRDAITEEMVRSFEIEAVQQAQAELDRQNEKEAVSFYCVGHSIVNYYLDDYPIKTFIGHKGKVATVDMLAAFLPSTVVESLYAVTDKVGLEVNSLTLEPIAAMNVIIPPEVRLINIALVDIGAGTSDIAIAKGGSIVAYAMATTAGDEITEEIIKKYLVDFDTAEQMKLNSDEKEIEYTDILGIKQVVSSEEFFASLFPAVEALAKTIAENITEANGGDAPAAVFLVGGGSQISSLASSVAKMLSLPENRVAVGGGRIMRHVNVKSGVNAKGPEFVTPVGIGVTATMAQGYDFSTILLNNKKIRVFNKGTISMLDLLSMAGYRSTNLIGRSGRNLAYTIDGAQKMIKGETANPAVITVNGLPANINTSVQKGDDVSIVPAVNGADAAMTLSRAVKNFAPVKIKLSGMEYTAGVFATVNGTCTTDGAYKIQNFDNITTVSIRTIKELLESLEASEDSITVFKGKRKLPTEYVLADGDEYTAEEKQDVPSEKAEQTPVQAKEEPVKEEIVTEESSLREDENDDFTEEEVEKILGEIRNEEAKEPAPKEKKHGVDIVLNGKSIALNKPEDNTDNIFLELMAFADIDTEKPKGDDIEMLINGKQASYMDILKDGDICSVKWITRRK